MIPRKIKVLIVDDSAVVRQSIAQALSQDRCMEIIGAVADPIFAMQRMRAQWPDVIVLDVEMPRMDGLTFLRMIMVERPTAVVVCSTLTGRGAVTSVEALTAGAVTVMEKPRFGARQYLLDASAELAHAVKAAAAADMRNIRAPMPMAGPGHCKAEPRAMPRATTDRVVAIGTSTGGTQALESILRSLPPVTPGIVVVQHMPERFTAAFAERLNSICSVEVKEAENNDDVLRGRALIAPGGKHMTLRRSGASYCVEVKDGPLVNHHRPSVDVLFRSVANVAGSRALGIIMTGMGADGALGLKSMREAGARTVAQDEATCVVFGMPKEAIKIGAADHVVPLGDIPGEVMRAL